MNRSYLVTLVIASSIAVACSSRSGGGNPQTLYNSSYPYTYKFFVNGGNGLTQVAIPPKEVTNPPSKTKSTHETRFLSKPRTLDTTTSLQPITSGNQTILTASADTLVVAAAAQCGMVAVEQIAASGGTLPTNDPAYQDILNQIQAGNPLVFMFPVYPAWGDANNTISTGYYIFPIGSAGVNSCDELLAFEEGLVCIADQLSQLADTVSPLTWHAAQFLGSPPAGYPQIPLTSPDSYWVLPPPAEADKFIVRDLAIDVLAHIPMFDSYSWWASNVSGVAENSNYTCADLYAAYSTTPNTQIGGKSLSDILFSPNYTDPSTSITYPPNPANSNTPNPAMRTIVTERQAFEGSVLRTAGQLLHDLIRESVYSDLAGSAAAGEATGDTIAGQLATSGLNGTQPYNSLAHIARTLLGRWEMDPPYDSDPECGGFAELELFPNLADNGMKARANDLGAVTSAQATAESLFERAGLVVADGATVDLPGALTTQLQAVEAASLQIPVAQLPAARIQAISNLVSSLSASDLARGVTHNAVTFSILTNASTSVPTGAIPSTTLGTAASAAGLTVSSITNSALGTSGIAIDGGLARANATTDPVARSGSMMVASQCIDPGGLLGTLQFEGVPESPVPASAYVNSNVAVNGLYYPSLQVSGNSMRQDAFAVANAIRSRLVRLRQLADGSAPVTSASSADAQARAAAVAEMGAWAGTDRLVITTDVSDQAATAPPTNVYLKFVGATPSEFGLTSELDLSSNVALVFGDAHLAECAAHLSTVGCNPTAASAATWTPSNVGYSPAGASAMVDYGITGDLVTLTFPMSTAPAAVQQAFAFSPSGYGPNSPLVPFYVLLAQDPSKQPGVGEVLGAVAVPITEDIESNDAPVYGEGSFALSPMRRELLNDAFGLGKWVGAAPPQSGERDSAGSPSYCVEGVPRDIFVPLQNDLTDSTDSYENSWSHYLSLAQSAATNADSLAEQLVDIGFQQTQTVEDAAQQLLTTVGVPTDVSSLSIGANGTISAGASNGALAAVLNPPKLDVVLFGTDPNGTAGTTSATTLATDLGCPGQSATSPCPSASNAPPICTRLCTSGVTVQPVTNVAAWSGPTSSTTVYYTALGLTQPPSKTAAVCTGAVAGAMAFKGLQNSGGTVSYSSSTKFNGGSFASSVGSLDGTAIANALQSVQMIVNDTKDDGTTSQSAHWQVTYQGTTIMDSDDFGSWPGCLWSSSTSPCNFSNPVIAAFNDMFRWDPHPRTDPLGTNYLNGGQQPDPGAELNDLRWRIEGALWLAAAMAGDIPQGMFTAPIPAVNFPSNGPYSAPVGSVFATGAFTVSGSTVTFASAPGTGQPADPGENAQLGTAGPVSPTSRYFDYNISAANNLPLWLETIYAPTFATTRWQSLDVPGAGPLPFNSGDQPTSTASGAPSYVHVVASNVDGTSNYSNLNPFFNTYFNQSGLSNQVPPAYWGKMAGLLNNQQCQNPTKDLISFLANTEQGGSNLPLITGLVAALKTEQDTGSPMEEQFNLTDGSSAGELATTYHWNSTGSCAYNAVLPGQVIPGFEPVTSNLTPCLSEPQWFDQVAVRWRPSVGPFTQVLDYLSPWGSGNPFFSQANPSQTSPGARLRFYLNSGAPSGQCDAGWQLTQAMALSCLLGFDIKSNLPPVGTEPPNLQTPGDLAALTGWLSNQVAQAQAALANAYVTSVPATVIANAQGGQGTLSNTAGTVGQDLAQASNALISLYSSWQTMLADARGISDQMAQTQAAIALVNAQGNETAIQNYISQLSSEKSIATDVAQIVSGVGQMISALGNAVGANANPFGVVGGLLTGGGSVGEGISALTYDEQILSQVQKLQIANMQTLADQVNVDIADLNTQINAAATAMSAQMATLREDINNLSAGTAALTTDENTAAYYAGKATGADVWQCGSSPTPQECVSHVNTVLNRRYDGTQIRYQQALNNAKAIAYLARLSIEQRLGIRLTDLTTPIGTLNAPSTWADDVCHLTGVNYQQLANELPDAGSIDQQQALDQQIAGEFADQFIGDYVQELTDFVTFYNTTYPEQDGNDTAVLSLRETLLGGSGSCQAQSANLLSDSSRLYALVDGAGGASVLGWTRDACASGDAYCLQPKALPGIAPPALPGGVTWLYEATNSPPVDGGVPINNGAISGGPDDVESQAVSLPNPGTYILSWWDLAVDSNGNATAQAQPAYQVGVYDSSWAPIAGYTEPPTPASDGGSAWGSRISISFTLTNADVVHVVFGASAGGGSPGSVAIANVQLEAAPSSGSPSAYVDTNNAGLTTSFDCAMSPAAMQSLFTRNCDPDGTCHYDLNTPITINTQTMTSNGASLAGKLATGNFNFRHIDVGVNVVGTGVIDCTSTGSPDCYGSGYVQYDLVHDGSQVGVLGFDNQYRTFDFGIGSILHGKALTAERYITTPIGSADQQLISQVLQTQFRGRPIDGVYKLSIYDSPVLHFQQIQDVQIILNNYHYWSRVQTSNNSN